MNGDWRIPTSEQFSELLNFTQVSFISNYKGTEINGLLFTSTINTHLFIPMSGYCVNGMDSVGSGNQLIINSSKLANSSGYYSPLYMYASKNTHFVSAMDYSREFGLPIRPVITSSEYKPETK